LVSFGDNDPDACIDRDPGVLAGEHVGGQLDEDAVSHKCVEMYVTIDCGSEAVDERDAADALLRGTRVCR
jgi:hypothetical protein